MNDMFDMFDQNEIDFFQKIFKTFADAHPKYINDENGPYVYGRADNWIIVFEKIYNTITNENRPNIVCSKYAEYIADKLKVVLIFNKYNPTETIKSLMTIPEICGLITYDVDILLWKKGQNIYYYKSIIVPYFMESVNSYYNGLYVGWYDSGFISEKGYYLNGERSGIWKFGQIIKKTKIITNDDFTCIEYENGNVINNINQVVIYNPFTHSNLFVNINSKNPYIKLAWNSFMTITTYIDSYVPGYIPNNWKNNIS